MIRSIALLGAVSIIFFSCGTDKDTSCTVNDNGDGTTTITCEDGTSTTFYRDVSCTVTDNGDGTQTISCNDGTSVVVSDGEDGAVVIVRLDGEPPGENCTHGGTAVHAGIDDNGDGQLSDDEISSTSFLCDGWQDSMDDILEGSYAIQNDEDVKRAAGFRVITGDLIVYAHGLTSVRLPLLEQIGGSLKFTAAESVTEISMPSLEYIGGQLSLTPSSQQEPMRDLVAVDLSSLGIIDFDMDIAGCNALTDLSLPVLTRVSFRMIIEGNDVLTNLSLPALTWVAQASIRYNDSLTNLEGLSNLETVADYFLIQYSDALESLEGLQNLTTVGNELRISGNPSLVRLGMDSLIHVGQRIWIYENLILPTCEAEALIDQINAAGGLPGDVLIRDNDDTGTCP